VEPVRDFKVTLRRVARRTDFRSAIWADHAQIQLTEADLKAPDLVYQECGHVFSMNAVRIS